MPTSIVKQSSRPLEARKRCAICTNEKKLNSYGVCSRCATQLEEEVKLRDADVRVIGYLYDRLGLSSPRIRRMEKYARERKLTITNLPPIHTEDIRRQVYAEHGLSLNRGRPQKEAV